MTTQQCFPKTEFPRIRAKLVSSSGVKIYGWKAWIPNVPSAGPMPMLQVTDATEFDYLHDLDHPRYDTTIWYTSARGERIARRMMLELAETGVAILWPGEGDIIYQVGARHQIIHIRPRRAEEIQEGCESDDD